MKRRVIFRADGNADIGYGHFIRTLGIAGLIYENFDCIYACEDPTEYQLKEINKICNGVIKLKKGAGSRREFLTHLKKDDIVVLDDYFFNSDYQLEIKNKGCAVIYIDDHNNKQYVCDVLINNIPGFAEESFAKESYTKLCLGTDYALLRKAFFNPGLRQVKKIGGNIFLAFGGADPFNISAKIIAFLSQINIEYKINLLIGDANKHFDDFKKINNLTVYKNISENEVAALIAAAEICVVPASSLLNEVACIGSKTLLGYFADNQVQPYKYFVENELATGLGDYRQIDFNFFEKKLHEAMKNDDCINNQRKIYNYQQEDNLRKIFFNV